MENVGKRWGGVARGRREAAEEARAGMGRRGRGALRLLVAAVAAGAALGGALAEEDDGSEPIWTGLFAAVELDDPECVARLTPPPRLPPSRVVGCPRRAAQLPPLCPSGQRRGRPPPAGGSGARADCALPVAPP